MSPFRAHLTLALAASFAGAAACNVEAPLKQDAGAKADASADAGARDGGKADGGGSCRSGGLSCPEGTFCAADGACKALSGTCRTSADCGAPQSCVRGLCRLAPGACRSASDCALNEICSPSGWCLPGLTEDGQLGFRCLDDSDCGHDLCRDEVCTPCVEGRIACPGMQECFFGSCMEAFGCTSDAQCYPGNRCMGMQCVRTQAHGCRPDPGNDSSTGAVPLAETNTATVSICGDDVDWYRFSLEAHTGARLVITSTPSISNVSASVLTAGDEEELSDLGGVAAPGVRVIEIAASNDPRDLLLRVEGDDASGPYAIDFRRLPAYCARDAFDLYGDTDPGAAPVVPTDVAITRRACVGDVDALRVLVERDDRVSLNFTLEGEHGSSLGVGVQDAFGMCALLNEGGQCLTPVIRSDSRIEVSHRPEQDSKLRVIVTGSVVPSEGQAYDLEVTRVRGSRIRACADLKDVTDRIRVSLSDAEVEDLGAPSCPGGTSFSPSPERDRIVRLSPPAASPARPVVMRAVATALDPSAGEPAIALLPSCETDLTALACDRAPRSGAPAAIEHVLTSTAPLFLMVSTDTSSAAPRVDVEVTFDAADNYTCRSNNAEPILGSGSRTVSTIAATNTVELVNECGSESAGSGAGPDRFYSLSLRAGDRAALELSGPEDGMLWVGMECLRLSDTCTAAASISRRSPARVVLSPRSATNYLVAVDGVETDDANVYTMRTVINPQCVSDAECNGRRCDDFVCVPPPPNDRCAGAITATLTAGRATIRGSTGAATDDFVHPCGSGGNLGREQPDVVYKVHVPAGTRELTARITEAAWDPVLAIRLNVCDAVTAQMACNDDQAEVPYPMSLLPGIVLPRDSTRALVEGDYYFIVDGYSGSGPFTLEIEAR